MSMLLSVVAQSRRRGFDPDAADYFARIVTAGSTISETNKTAVNAFIVGCKADGIWSAIKASCILAGADTLAGALVPLVGAAPTNVGGLFVAGDYSRTMGLIGNGTTKHLNSNRANNADPQNNQHLAVHLTSADPRTENYFLIGAGAATTGASHLQNLNGNTQAARSQSTLRQALTSVDTTTKTGFMGISRASSVNYDWRLTGLNGTASSTSQTPLSSNISVFGESSAPTQARISYYSIGESLDLALLDARLTTLMASLT